MKAWLGALAAVGALTAGAGAQQEAPVNSAALGSFELESILKGFTTLNTDYRRATRSSDPINIFRDLDLEFVYIESPSGENVPGIWFNYDRVFGTPSRASADDNWSTYLALKSTGTLSFDGRVQPRDMLSTSLTFRSSYDAGGVSSAMFAAGSPAANMAALERLVDLEDPAELVYHPDYLKAMNQVAKLLDNQTHFDFGVDLGLENTQDWSQRQLRFGVAGSYEFKAFDPHSKLRWLNLPDYPVSFVRWLTRYDEEWGPSGVSFPSLNVDVSQVFVEDNRARRQAGDESDFTRLHGELAYRSPLGEIGRKLYYVDMGYHYYLDVDPSNSIEAAELDAYDYLKVEFTSDEGVFFSIDVGQLPFEARDTTVMSLGYRVAAR